jgi:Mce-associated membrane protein
MPSRRSGPSPAAPGVQTVEPAPATAATATSAERPAEPDLEPDATEDVAEDAAQDAAGDAAEPAAPRRRRGPGRPAVLGVLTVLLGGFAIWSGVQANHLTSAPAGSNTALSDRAATTRIIGQITGTVNSIFSYNYSDPARTARAARKGLTGAAVRQYRGIYATMQRDASRYTRLVLTTTVTNAGVELLQGNHARVLVFGSQVLTSGSEAPQSFGAMVALDLVQQGGTWKIDNIDTFNGNP